MITFLKKYLLSIVVILVTFVLCFMNTSTLPAPPIMNFDKVVHIIMFMGISEVIFFDNTYYLRFPISKIRIFFSVFLFPIALGGLIEILQEYLTQTRSGDWYDFLFDVVGVFLGLGIILLINSALLLRKKN